MALRFYNRFTSADGSQEVVFPTHHLEAEIDQDLHNSFAELTGASYSYDMVGNGPAPKKNAIVRLRFLAVGETAPVQEDLDAQVETIRDDCYEFGRGKLYRKGANGGEDWAWARIQHMAQIRVTYENLNHLPVSLAFEVMSDWQAES